MSRLTVNPLGPRLGQAFLFLPSWVVVVRLRTMQQRAPYRACGRGSIPAVPLFRCVRLNVEPRFRDVAHPR